ncbi:MAG: 30S ribosomal protein S16 [Planctomycetota bacterium]
MVRIRMQRLGRTHRPFYRIAAAEKRVKRDGKVLENLGWYNPIEKDPGKQLELKAERIKYWLSVGAQPSDTMMDILGRNELLTPKLKEKWEAKREADRNRVGCKVGLKVAEDSQSAFAELPGSIEGGADVEADIAGFGTTINEAVKEAQAAVAEAKPADADAAKAKAESALSDARKAVEAAVGAKKKADEEAAAKEAAEASSDSEPAEAGDAGGDEKAEG